MVRGRARPYTAAPRMLAPLHRHLCAEPILPSDPGGGWEPGFEPHRLLASFAGEAHVTLLDNPGPATELGRWAFLCADPVWVFRSKRGQAWSGPPGAERAVADAPLAHLAELLRRFRAGRDLWAPGLPRLCGGAVGYLGYELLYQLEAIPDTGRDEPELPDVELSFCRLVFAHDRLSGAAWLLATGFGEDPAAAEADARTRIASGRERLASLGPSRPAPAALEPAKPSTRPRLREQDLARHGVRAWVDRPGYLAAIAEVQRNIAAGNVFEVCLTQRFDLEFGGSGLTLYAALRRANPAPMAAYLRTPHVELLSASPERCVAVDRAGVVETRPIKGTRPRDPDPRRDAALRAELAGASKDRAENLMIVDLARNDLGKVCRFGTVEVTRLCAIEAYPFTWQMVSTIRGQLDDRHRHDPVAVLRAVFPGGSMTGAPKVEAMKIIDRLEPSKRGVFSGAIGYIDYDGAMDWSIVIRTFVKRGDRLSFHVGGAIVADSDPAEEYQETLDKAAGLIAALDQLDPLDPLDPESWP
jgi:para-aminobenzoate synthetase component I